MVMNPAVYTNINDGIVITHGVAVIVVTAINILVYRHDSGRRKRIISSSEFESLNSEMVCKLLKDNGYDPVLF